MSTIENTEAALGDQARNQMAVTVTHAEAATRPGAVAIPGVVPDPPGHNEDDNWRERQGSDDEDSDPARILSWQENSSRSFVVAIPVTEENHSNLPRADPIDHPGHGNNSSASRNNKTCRGCYKSILVRCILGACLVVIVGGVLVMLLRPGPGPEFHSAISEGPLESNSKMLSLLPGYTQEAINISGTPQQRAFQWLNLDPNLDSYPEWRIVQRYSLASFFYATNGHDWNANRTWLSYEKEECDWFWKGGNLIVNLVAISEPHYAHLSAPFRDLRGPCKPSGEYQHFWLPQNNLKGTLPPEFFLLTSLKSIVFFDALLAGTISSHIGNMARLEAVGVIKSGFTGSIPSEIGLAQSLNAVAFSYMQLDGHIPSEIGMLTEMYFLNLLENRIEGTLPIQLGMLTNLQYLMIESNLTGGIPSHVGLLTSLQELSLPNNYLTGPIPAELGSLSNLEHIYFYDNALTGKIPTELGLLTELDQLYLHNNRLSGQIPSELGLMTKMTQLYISNNSMTGTIPIELNLLTVDLFLWGNSIDEDPDHS